MRLISVVAGARNYRIRSRKQERLGYCRMDQPENTGSLF